MSHKSVPQQCPTRVSYKSVPQEFPTRVSHKSVPQECPVRVSHKSFLQECPTRVSYKSVIWTYVAFRTCLHSGSWAPSCFLCRSSSVCPPTFICSTRRSGPHDRIRRPNDSRRRRPRPPRLAYDSEADAQFHGEEHSKNELGKVQWHRLRRPRNVARLETGCGHSACLAQKRYRK